MKQPAMLSICGKQRYVEQEPDIIEFVTEGTIEEMPDGWEIVYNESSLTGMEGVTTSFYFNAFRNAKFSDDFSFGASS